MVCKGQSVERGMLVGGVLGSSAIIEELLELEAQADA